MKTGAAISRMLVVMSALTLCLMGGTKFVYAESNGTNGTGDGLATEEAKQVIADRNLSSTDIAEGDDMYENWRELPMSVPDVSETRQASQEFQGYDS